MRTGILLSIIFFMLLGLWLMPDARSETIMRKGVVIGGTELKVTGALYDCATDRLTATVSPLDKDAPVSYAVSCETKNYTYLNEKGEAVDGLEPLDKKHLEVFDLLCTTIKKSRKMCDPNNDEPTLNYGWK